MGQMEEKAKPKTILHLFLASLLSAVIIAVSFSLDSANRYAEAIKAAPGIEEQGIYVEQVRTQEVVDIEADS